MTSEHERIVAMEKRRAELEPRVVDYVKMLFQAQQDLDLDLVINDEGDELVLYDKKNAGTMFPDESKTHLSVTVFSGVDEIYFRIPFSETRDKVEQGEEE